MKVSDLERLVSSYGVSSSKMGAVTRELRHSGRLPVKGRGPNALDLDPSLAAMVLIATAGSGKAVKADSRLNSLENLIDVSSGKNLLDAFTEILDGQSGLKDVIEVRIGRNIREASIVYTGKVVYFRQKIPRDYRSHLRVEGILPYTLLRLVSELIRMNASFLEPNDLVEPDDDA